MECIDSNEEEYRKELNYQLELLSKLDAANSADINNYENNQADLFNLEQSLIKMTRNETFIEEFKSNEVTFIINLDI